MSTIRYLSHRLRCTSRQRLISLFVNDGCDNFRMIIMLIICRNPIFHCLRWRASCPAYLLNGSTALYGFDLVNWISVAMIIIQTWTSFLAGMAVNNCMTTILCIWFQCVLICLIVNVYIVFFCDYLFDYCYSKWIAHILLIQQVNRNFNICIENLSSAGMASLFALRTLILPIMRVHLIWHSYSADYASPFDFDNSCSAENVSSIIGNSLYYSILIWELVIRW